MNIISDLLGKNKEPFYEVDLDKVETVNDLKLLLQGCIPKRVLKRDPQLDKVKHLLKGFDDENKSELMSARRHVSKILNRDVGNEQVADVIHELCDLVDYLKRMNKQ